MKDDLERVLEGLGRVEVPAELAGRVLRAMETPRRRQFAWAWVVAMAAIVLALIGGFLEGRWLSESREATVQPVADLIVPPPRQVRDGRGTERLGMARSRPLKELGRPTHRKLRDGWGTEAFEQPVPEMEAGFTAPAAPLTEQEKLLLRLARHANGGTVAMFDPKIREERAEAEKAEFEFFNPPPAVIAAEPEETEHVGKQSR